MNKLEYDTLYKFLVSLGIVLIVLPAAVLVFWFNSDLFLISQSEYESLSAFSLYMLQQRALFASGFGIGFPWVAGISVLSGLFLLIFGICKWAGIQKKLDKKLDAETTMQTLAALEMTNKEVVEKVEAETRETPLAEVVNPENSPIDHRLHQMKKYLEIEDLCFKHFVRRYKKYDFRRNIRIGQHQYDFIGVSQKDSIDLVVEVKYWDSAIGIARPLYGFLDKFYDAGIKYEMVAHRNFRCIAVLVTTKEQLPRLQSNVETYRKAHRENASRIEIECYAEEAI